MAQINSSTIQNHCAYLEFTYQDISIINLESSNCDIASFKWSWSVIEGAMFSTKVIY
jgi:hypothetical protein